MSLSLYLLSGFIMFLLEYFVLLRLYKRSPALEKISLIVAPIMIILALFITNFIQSQFTKSTTSLNPLILFIVLVLLELPLSLYGYDITPNASIPERLIVAGSIGVSSVLIANGILNMFL